LQIFFDFDDNALLRCSESCHATRGWHEWRFVAPSATQDGMGDVCPREMSIMRKTWAQRLLGHPKREERKRTYWPYLEELEQRQTPTTFTWTNGTGDGKWETANNWGGSDGTSFPGWNGSAATNNDVAVFNGGRANANSTMGSAHTLSAVSLVNNYSGKLSLQAQLTLSGGTSTMTSGTILQNDGTHNGPIVVQASTSFLWYGGDINPSGAGGASGASTFTVQQNGNLTCNNGFASNNFGDNLNNDGLVVLNNDWTITLVNKPTITNTATGEIRITVNNSFGIAVATGDPVKTIQNTGLIDMQAGAGNSYSFADPVSNNSVTAKIWVDTGFLRFKGADPAGGGWSVHQSQGTIEVDGAAKLTSDYGLYQEGGTIIGLRGATFDGDLSMSGGTLQQGDGTSANVGIIYITGNFSFGGGTLQIWEDLSQGSTTYGQVFVRGGSGVAVTPASTSIHVSLINGPNQPWQTMDSVLLATATTASITGGLPTVSGGGYNAASLSSFGGGTNNDLSVKRP
jgi:hypothetical protein